MTVKTLNKKALRLKKEQQVPVNAPNYASPEVDQQLVNDQQQVADHVHPEYDQALIKIQEIEQRMNELVPNDLGAEQMTGKDSEQKYMEKIVRKVIKEELKGIPEEERSNVTKKKIGPENTDQIPESTQPAKLKAPSGGGFDSDDVKGDKIGNEAEKEVTKPASDYTKTQVMKNRFNMAKRLVKTAEMLLEDIPPEEDEIDVEEDEVKSEQVGEEDGEDNKSTKAKPMDMSIKPNMSEKIKRTGITKINNNTTSNFSENRKKINELVNSYLNKR